jgi:hypothetical protein
VYTIIFTKFHGKIQITVQFVGNSTCSVYDKKILLLKDRGDKKIMLSFEWDFKKAKTNEQKHGINFHEASTVFADSLSLTISDPLHSDDEKRFIIIGMSYKDRLLTVVHTDCDDKIRIISARKATKKERSYYEYDEK